MHIVCSSQYGVEVPEQQQKNSISAEAVFGMSYLVLFVQTIVALASEARKVLHDKTNAAKNKAQQLLGRHNR